MLYMTSDSFFDNISGICLTTNITFWVIMSMPQTPPGQTAWIPGGGEWDIGAIS